MLTLRDILAYFGGGPLAPKRSVKTCAPSSAQQAYLIERAKAKRARRAEKLTIVATFAYFKNDAHSCSPTFDPHYLAK